jgi:hypothetical protein
VRSHRADDLFDQHRIIAIDIDYSEPTASHAGIRSVRRDAQKRVQRLSI